MIVASSQVSKQHALMTKGRKALLSMTVLFYQWMSGMASAIAGTQILTIGGAGGPSLAITTTLNGGGSGTAGGGASTAASLGDVFCNAANNIAPFVQLFDWLAYTAGAYAIASGVYMLAKHVEAPNQATLPHAFAKLVGGALLLALPCIAGTVIHSFFFENSGSSSGSWTCIGSGSSSASVTLGGTGSVTLDVLMQNMVNNIKGPLISMLTIICFAFGAFLVLRGGLRATKYGTDPREASMTKIISSMLFGAVFMVIGQSQDMIMGSVFGQTSIHDFGSLSWTAINKLGTDTSHFKAAIQAALTFFQLVGFIGFVRGWNVLKNAVEGHGQATYAQGFSHIVGGVLSINIYYFMQIMDATFGTQFVT